MVDIISSAVDIAACIGTFLESHEAALTVIAAAMTAVATVVIGLFTYYLWKSTNGLTVLATEQEKMTRTIERAYVKMSHLLPGVTFEQDGLICRVKVQMRIKNYGRTPARVTDILLRSLWRPQGEPLPKTPDYQQSGENEAPKMFLVTGEEVFTPKETESIEFTAADVKNGVKQLWLYGCVDYIDQFGQRHRAGYAMSYNPQLDQVGMGRNDVDNLVFETQDGYIYDRQRKRGEGNDWDEPN
jgi:hypothetical protein